MDFIEQALNCHQVLWHYSDYLKSCDIHSIYIDSENVYFVVGPERVKLSFPFGESRVVPLEVLNFKSYEPIESKAMNILADSVTSILDMVLILAIIQLDWLSEIHF